MLEHSWLFCAAWVGGLSFIFGKIKSKALVEAGEYSSLEVNRYLKGFSSAVIIPSLIFWGLQQSISQPVSIDFNSCPNPQFAIAITILLALWASILIWTLFFGGSLWLSLCLRLMGNFPQFMLKPLAIKVLVVLAMVSGVSSLLMERV